MNTRFRIHTVLAAAAGALLLFEPGAHFRAKADVELIEPGAQHLLEPAGHAFLIAEVDDVDRAAALHLREAVLQRLAPIVHHRKRVGIDQPIERAVQPHRRGLEIRRERGCEFDPPAQARARHRLRRRLQHLARRIDAVERRLRMALGQQHEVARCAAADFADMIGLADGELFDQPVAAEQIVLAGEIVDVPLMTVHLIHRHAGVCRHYEAFKL